MHAMPKALTMLASVLDRAAAGGSLPAPQLLCDMLDMTVRQGGTLQARILLTATPAVSKYLTHLPAPAWFDECWPGTGWPLTLPALTQGATPYFSVVTPAYNQGIFLSDTITGVMRQGFASYEHIVMDGGSTDGTLDLLRANPHIFWTSESDRGQTHALNKALRQARGEVIAWINSDDFYLPGTFEAVHDFFSAHPEEDVLTGDCLWGWEGSGRLRYVSGEERDFESLIRQWNGHVPGPQPCIFFRRRVLEQTGLGDESLHYGMDYDLWLRMALGGHVRRHVEAPLAFYRFHGHSKSGAQQDWTPFYADWHTCFTRYRQHSRVLPPQRLLGVAYPLRTAADARERASLCAALRLCAQWKFRDIDLVLVTDMPGAHREDVAPGERSSFLSEALPGLPPLSLPLRVATVPHLDTGTFVQSAVEAAPVFALCLPPISSAVPYEQWYVGPLNALLDNPDLARTSLWLRRGRLPGHPLLPPDGPFGCLAMHRRDALGHDLGGHIGG